MAAQTNYSYTGLAGALIKGLQSMLNPPMYAAMPSQPNPQSQVLVARQMGWVVDPGSPASAYHPAGYATADLWYDPINPTYASNVTTQKVWDNQRGQYVDVVTAPQARAPHMYYVKSTEPPPPNYDKVSSTDSLFKAPESAVIAQNPCEPVPASVAATDAARLNRLTLNQFFSPFRARRSGGNSYQALSEAEDNIFSPTGQPGDFTKTAGVIPAFLQSRRNLRAPVKG